jgi:ribonuclease HI
LAGWQKNNWQTKAKEEVLNKDLWLDLAFLAKDKKIKWHYVGGHIGIAGNERCDEIASGFASGETVTLYAGNVADYKIDVLNLSHSAVKKKNKKAKSSSSGVKAYSYLSLVNGKLHKDKTWAECEKRVKGVKGTKYKKSISAEDEKEIIKSWGI